MATKKKQSGEDAPKGKAAGKPTVVEHNEKMVPSVEVREAGVPMVVQHMDMIMELYNHVLKRDVHYGVIPNTAKPSLLKAGAEKILFMLKLRPVIHEMKKEWIGTDGRHINITVVMSLYGRDNDVLWGQGVGSCTTMEKKYRYRTTWVEREEVPKEYWKTRNKALLKGMVPKKINGAWMLCETKKSENEDVAEVWNTVVKMAKKRALVDAVLTIAGVSDLFTQDIEEFSEHEQNTQEDDVETPPESSGKAPQEQKPATTRKDTGNPVGEPQKGISGSPTTDVAKAIEFINKCESIKELVKTVAILRRNVWTEEAQAILNKAYNQKLLALQPAK